MRTSLSDAIARGVVDGAVYSGILAGDLQALEAVWGPFSQRLVGR